LPFANDNAPHRSAGDLINDYRARRALEERGARTAKARRPGRAALDLNPPKVRIRAWEKVHGLRMPARFKTTRILEVIASDTRLTLVEVQEEQQARVAESTRRLQKPSEPTAA